MHIVAIIVGLLLTLVIAWDGFETIILPRRVAHKFRISHMFYVITWKGWAALGRKMRSGNRREQYLGYYGPLSLILLLAVWATGFIFAFALFQWGIHSPLNAPDKTISFTTYFYMSGTTFFTLGLGDVTPLEGWARTLIVLEAGTGFAFLALVIGYVPVIYQSFSRRETVVALLDARASSPPCALELLRRHAHCMEEVFDFLHEWERWSSELLESHLSYSVLAYYRSQHERQSWLAALATVLDTCALLLVGFEGKPVKTAKFPFAIARHAAVDLSQNFGIKPIKDNRRLSSEDFARLRVELAAIGLVFSDGDAAEQRLTEIRRKYEPFLLGLSQYLLLPLPAWINTGEVIDDWQTSAWDHFLDTSPRTLDFAMQSE